MNEYSLAKVQLIILVLMKNSIISHPDYDQV